MADFVLTPFGRRFFLLRAMDPGTPESTPINVGLYQNDYTPAVGDDGSAIVESDFAGYEQVALADGTWADPVMDGDLAVSAAGTTPVFTSTTNSGQQAFGCFMVETADGFILGAMRFDETADMTAGAVVTLDPFEAVLPLV